VIVRIPIKQPTGQVDAKGEQIMQEVLTDARVLPAGSGFGELALMNNKPRAATIVCNEDCEFAVLEKEPFIAILSKEILCC
jgi:CRP-like cAMP-binding protein